MHYGYHGRILRVDLGANKLKIEQRDDAFYRLYMGGTALGMYYLLNHTPAGIDAFDPGNTLVLALSVMTGAPISGQSRMTAVAKSPLTGCVGESQGGGFFPAEMKFAGFDAVVVQGRAEKPVYLWMSDDRAELRPATNLWGKTTYDVERILKAELGDQRVRVLQCGPAGEKRVRFASLMSDCTRANGRTGMGAVMGAKNLKAIAVRGHEKPSLANSPALAALAKWGVNMFPESAVCSLRPLGTAGIVVDQQTAGGLPTRNWQSGAFEGWQALDGRTMAKSILMKNDTCYGCAIRCKRVVESNDGRYRLDPVYGGPEYETIACFGSYCGIDDLQAVAYANQLCNMYGMDTISCGATIAWAMDCFERGILTRQDTGGVELRFGNADGMIRMVEMIAKRKGFGDMLAEGSYRAAARIGRGATAFVVAVKKQELPAHMPQVKRSLALVYAVNPAGADHVSSEHDPSYRNYQSRMAEIGLTDPQPDSVLNMEKVRYALVTEYFYSCLDSLTLCQFVFGPAWQLYGPSQMVEAVRATTGWDVTLDELMRVGERALNMLRAFNARDGVGRESDELPGRLHAPLVGGMSDGVSITREEVEVAKERYYAMAGWEVARGIPTRAKLRELGLDWIAEKMDL